MLLLIFTNIFIHIQQLSLHSRNIFIHIYHRFRWYATLENKTPAETFPKFPSVFGCSENAECGVYKKNLKKFKKEFFKK